MIVNGFKIIHFYIITMRDAIDFVQMGHISYDTL